MLVYTVVGSPVLVRQIPSADAKIMNVLPTGSKLYVVSSESGWLRTSSGYYVFQTDDVVRDPSPAQSIEAINSARGVRLMAATRGPTIDPSLDDDDTMDVPSVAEGMRATRQTTVEPSGDDSVHGSSEASEALTEKYQGKRVKVTGGETCYQMVDGQWVEVEMPESLKSKGNGSAVIAVDDRGYFGVVDENGQVYRIDGTHIAVSDASSDGKVGEYTQFELEELQQENRDADEFIDEIKRTLNSAVEMVQSMDKLTIETTRTVFGMPYQFLPTTDPRPGSSLEETFDDKRFGRKYMEKIVARAPVLVMQPGEAVFLRGYSDDVKQRVMEEVLGLISSVTNGDTELEQILNGGGEYYSFRLKHTDYYSCINGALRAVAIMMGLENVEVPGLSSGSGTLGEVLKELGQNELGSFNWLMNSQHPLGGYYAGAVQFYINSEAQIQENFNTGTRPSQLASKINQISDQAAEAMFVMGGLRADFAKTTGSDEDVATAADDITEGALSLSPSSAGLLHNIIRNISTLLAGGKMHFPEIWSDSQFQRAYNVTIKLDSPDCDPLSIYLNIMVPLIHILGFVLPRSAGDNTYISPFLVRCFYKSMFHIDMGMITSCDVVKGDQGAWTNSGLPTQVTVQLSIKDLYSVMTQSRGVGSNTLLGNPAQMDYLANLCGINVAPSNFGRTLKLWWMLKGPQRAIDSVVNSGARLITDVYKTIYNFASPSRWAM